jgi:acetyl-CoA carboxylase carboxyl transferase subunit beta
MNFGDMFKSFRKSQPSEEEAPSHWIKCPKCNSLMYYKEVENLFHVCPKCKFHMRVGQEVRIKLLADKDTFIEFDKDLVPVDPLKFTDKKSYKKRVIEAEKKTGKSSSVVSGECKIDGIPTQLVVFDFKFMGGSLGSVEGEKIVRAAHRAIEKREALIIVSASGGARMQESTFSLLQMSKTSAALKRVSQNGLPFISILTDPTMGGVSASFAMLGDVIIAEPGALIGFAGQRVIKQTIGAELPAGFQRSEFLLEHGFLDMIVKRENMKKTVSDLLYFFDNGIENSQKKISSFGRRKDDFVEEDA